MTSRSGVAVGALVAAGVLLAGCASGSAGAPAQPASPTPVSDTSSPQPTPDASTVGQVTGEVLTPDGSPAVGCSVDKGGGTEEAIVTDASGRFEFSQAPGEWTLRFACSGADDQDATPVTVTGGEVTTVQVRLSSVR